MMMMPPLSYKELASLLSETQEQRRTLTMRIVELQDAIRSVLTHYLLRDDGALYVTLWAYADDFGGERRRISREHTEALRLMTTALRNSSPPDKTHVPAEESSDV